VYAGGAFATAYMTPETAEEDAALAGVEPSLALTVLIDCLNLALTVLILTESGLTVLIWP